jgi:cysteine desulfurase / selenocysteine lyase
LVIPEKPDWTALRRKFPVLSHSTYLATAAAGPVSTDSAAAAATYYRWSGCGGDLASEKWLPETEDCRAAVARQIGATPAEIGFVTNTSMAISCAALLFEGQGAVLTAQGEHPSVVTPWHARRFRIDKAKPNADGLFTAACYGRALRPDTKVISISHVRFNDGQVNDLTAIGALARDRGIHLVVDAIQSIGILPVNVEVGIDVLGFGGFKWLNAGHGTGALFVRNGLLEEYGLPIAGRRSRATAELIEIESLDPLNQACAFELGAMPVPNIMALHASLRLIESIGNRPILSRVAALTAKLRSGLRRLGLETATDFEHCQDHLTPIVSVRTANAEALANLLATRNVHTSARGDFLRIAVSWYNNSGDVSRCLDALKETCGPSG